MANVIVWADIAVDPISVGAHPGLSSTNLQAAGPFLGGKLARPRARSDGERGPASARRGHGRAAVGRVDATDWR